MPHFVYDGTSLNYPKTNLNVLPPLANPAQYIQADDWNPAMQASVDLRDALKNGKYFGYETQASDPVPSGVSAYVYMNNASVLTVRNGVTTYTLVPSTRQVLAGAGLDGGGALNADVTLSLEPISPSPAGSYVRADVTVDIYGRVTAASSNGGSYGYDTMINDTTPLTGRNIFHVDGSTLVLSDDVPNTWTHLSLGANQSFTSLTLTGLTAGSVLFAGVAGLVQQDNANFFWDDSNNRLGLGTASPSTTLHVVGNTTFSTAATLTVGSNILIGSVADKLNAAFLAISSQAVGDLLGADTTSTFARIAAVAVGSVLSSAGVSTQPTWSSSPTLTGLTLSGITLGSVVFAGTSGVLSQDNANLFWDDSNNRLGIGNAAPAQALHVTGTGRFTAGIRLDTLTTGSVVFSAASGVLSQDNTNFFWDDTNNRLGLNAAGAPGAILDVRAPSAEYPIIIDKTATANTWGYIVGKRSGVVVWQVGVDATDQFSIWAGAAGDTLSFSAAPGVWYMVHGTSNRIQFGTAGQGAPAFTTRSAGTKLVLYPSLSGAAVDYGFGIESGFMWCSVLDSTGGWKWYAGTTERLRLVGDGGLRMPTSSAAVGGASTGVLRYNSTGQVFQVSLNAAAYVDVATIASSLTLGSVIFVGSSSLLSQDNANFFWDDSNNRLGIGNAAPSQALHVTGTGRFTAGILLDTMTTGSILFAGASGALSQDNANFFWDDTDNILKTTEIWQKDHSAFTGSESKTTTAAIQTTDATVTDLFTIALSDSTVYVVEVSVVGRDAAGTERAMYGKKALVYREGGGATLQGAVQDVHADVETTAGLDATIVVASNNAKVQVTGIAATTINWVATVKYQAVSLNT